MSDLANITPPPSVEHRIEQGTWPLSREAAEAMLRVLVRGKKVYPRAAFNAALDVERDALMLSHNVAAIERRAAEAARTGETMKVRFPKPHDIRNSRRKRVYVTYDIPITREFLYHALLGLPASMVPEIPKNTSDEEEGVPTVRLLAADGQTHLSTEPK